MQNKPTNNQKHYDILKMTFNNIGYDVPLQVFQVTVIQ